MSSRLTWTAAFAASLLSSSAFAQTNFPEVEPNGQKSQATPVVGMVAGDTISGVSTGTTTVLGDTAINSADVFRVRTGALPLGLYKHRLTLTTSTTTGHTGSIRGLNQTGTVGVGGTPGTVDTEIQTAITTSSPPRFNSWYGFGKQEEIYYRVVGTTTTTAGYTATLSTVSITPNVISAPFEAANPVTITTVGQTTVDTEILLYDSTFTPVPGGLNDHQYPTFSAQSTLTRTLPAGTYYAAISTFELCSDQPTPNDDNFVTGWMTDFPDCVVLSSSSLLTQDYDFQIYGSNGLWSQTNQLPAGDPYRVTWWQFTVAPGAPPIITPPPPNDLCANATSVAAGTTTGTLLGALNDGSATCDPGGAASRDVWYSFTNTALSTRVLTATTCGTTGVNDTVLSVYSSCGGAELACSDDCGGTPCGGPTSCVSGINIAPSQTVLLRVSDKGLGGLGGFTLVISVTALPPPHDSCATPIALSGFGTFPIDTLGATTGPEGQTESLCNFFGGTAVRQDVWYTWVATNSGAVTVTTCGLIASGPSQDSKIAIYVGAGCPTAGTALACNDDFTCTGFSGLNSTVTFNAVCGNTYTIQMGMYQGTALTMSGSFSVTGAGPACATPSTPFCLGDGTGAPCPCGNTGAAGHGCGSNAFAGGAILTSTGIAGASAGTDTLVLTATDIPGPGLFFQSNGLLGAPANFGDGHLCAAVGIIRLGVVFPTSGVASYPGGLTPNPIHIQGGTANGQTKHYQCWYRSVPGLCGPNNYDLTQGLTLVWGP
ncbi:MAG: hypothetical protein JNL28_14500 [Planctomycetes bacterium]|nr:hypothetical protein [Planctomycetota bacterium]